VALALSAVSVNMAYLIYESLNDRNTASQRASLCTIP